MTQMELGERYVREGRELFFKLNKRGEEKRGKGKSKGKKRKQGGEKEVKMVFWNNIIGIIFDFYPIYTNK